MNEKGQARHTEQSELMARLAERAQTTFWGLLGCEVVQANEEKALISMNISGQHLNLLGLVHGGVLMSLLDQAMALVVIHAAADERTVTANMNTHFLASSQGGMLLCEAELIHRTKRTLTLQGQVKEDNGTLLAWGSGVYRLV